jgi:hypothetical protein
MNPTDTTDAFIAVGSYARVDDETLLVTTVFGPAEQSHQRRGAQRRT